MTKKEIKKKIQRGCLNAEKILDAYGDLVEDRSGNFESPDEGVLIVNLLADIRHYCEKMKLSFAFLAADAAAHFHEEVRHAHKAL